MFDQQLFDMAEKQRQKKTVKIDPDKIPDEKALQMILIEGAIKRLYLNNYNYSQTARDVKVGAKVLRQWGMQYGKLILGDAWDPAKKGAVGRMKESDQLIMESNIPVQIKQAEDLLLTSDHTIIAEATKAQVMAINRLKILLSEADMTETTEAIRALHELLLEPKEEVKKQTTNFMQFIMNQVVNTPKPHNE